MTLTDEERSANGRKGAAVSAETKRRKRNMTGAERALLRLESNVDDLVDLCIQAAKGEGGFEDLKPAERASMLKFALEQVLGRPGARKPEAAPDNPEAEKQGLTFGTAPATRPGEEVGRGESREVRA